MGLLFISNLEKRKGKMPVKKKRKYKILDIPIFIIYFFGICIQTVYSGVCGLFKESKK